MRKLYEKKADENIEAKVWPNHIQMILSIIPGIGEVYGIYESEEHIYDYRQENKCKISVWK